MFRSLKIPIFLTVVLSLIMAGTKSYTNIEPLVLQSIISTLNIGAKLEKLWLGKPGINKTNWYY